MKTIHICMLFAAIATVGCGGAPVDDRPARTAVSGMVSLEGAPVEGVTIRFVPQAKSGRAGLAESAADGTFKATTFVGGDGLLPGTYNIAITKFAEGGDNEVENETTEDGLDVPGAPADAGRPERNSGPKSLLPEKYSEPSTSGLTVEVTDGKSVTDLALDLTN